MNTFLWILQGLLAFHTFTGAVWKFYYSEQTIPVLQALPHEVWLGLGIVELFVGLALVLPLFQRLGILAPIAATFITAEMVLYIGLGLASGNAGSGEIIYWLIVAVVAGFVAFSRFVLRPIGKA